MRETLSRFVVMDFERTGFPIKPNRGQIVEVGAVEVIDGVIGRTFEMLCNPGGPISAFAGRLHGITKDMIINAPSFTTVGQEIERFIGEDPVVLHGAMSDLYGWVHDAAISKVALPPSRKIFCSQEATRLHIPSLRKTPGLDAIANHLMISLEGPRHRALQDALLLTRCLLLLGGAKILIKPLRGNWLSTVEARLGGASNRKAARRKAKKTRKRPSDRVGFPSPIIQDDEICFGDELTQALWAKLPLYDRETHCPRVRQHYVIIARKDAPTIPDNPLGAAIVRAKSGTVFYVFQKNGEYGGRLEKVEFRKEPAALTSQNANNRL